MKKMSVSGLVLKFEAEIGGYLRGPMHAHIFAPQETAQRRLGNSRRFRYFIGRLAALPDGLAELLGNVAAHGQA